MSEVIFYRPKPKRKIRSQKRLSKSPDPVRRFRRQREYIISNEEIREALEYIGGDCVLQPFGSVR